MNAKIIHFPGCENSLMQSKPEEVYYGNPKSKKFHTPGCRYFNSTKDTVMFKSKKDLLVAHFIPCGLCCHHKEQYKKELAAFKKLQKEGKGSVIPTVKP